MPQHEHALAERYMMTAHAVLTRAYEEYLAEIVAAEHSVTLERLRPYVALGLVSNFYGNLAQIIEEVGLTALLTGLRRGELFALRWQAANLTEGHLTVQEAVYEGAFGTPKTDAGVRRVGYCPAPVAGALAEGCGTSVEAHSAGHRAAPPIATKCRNPCHPPEP